MCFFLFFLGALESSWVGLGDLHFSFSYHWFNGFGFFGCHYYIIIYYFSFDFLIYFVHKMTFGCLHKKKKKSDICKLKTTVLCLYIAMVVFTWTTGNDKFSCFIPMHMTLIDSMLWVMMCSVSQSVAHSSRPWRSFDVCFVLNVYTLLYIRCDISCSMFRQNKCGERQILLQWLLGWKLMIIVHNNSYDNNNINKNWIQVHLSLVLPSC